MANIAKRGATFSAVITVTDDNIDLTEWANVYLTIKQDNVTLKKSNDDLTITETTVTYTFTQAESLKFGKGEVAYQLDLVNEDGSVRIPSTIAYGTLLETILPVELP